VGIDWRFPPVIRGRGGVSAAEIKAALAEGKRVFWVHSGYEVIRDSISQYLIIFKPNGHAIGLTWKDGVTLNGNPADFFAVAA